ncbi:hypothetical protein ACT4MK_17795 [Bradyrhizobium barranii]|uniref:hypothetical protein n=1 Tax=Bradyrhizobium TaxID=374 RepID=UPI0033923E2B
MSDIHDAPPRMDPHSLALAVTTKPFNVFFYKTPDTLDEVLARGYFDEAVEHLIRKHDRIEVVADAGGDADFATLVVGSVLVKGGRKSVEVSKLERR